MADKVVELDYIDSISHEAIRRMLKKTKFRIPDLEEYIMIPIHKSGANLYLEKLFQ